MNRFPRFRESLASPALDSYIPSGASRGHSRPAPEPSNPPSAEIPALPVPMETPPNPETPPATPISTAPAARAPLAQASSDAAAPASAPAVAPPRRRPATSASESSLGPTVSPALERHQRKCSICRRQDRDDIEQAFLHWESLAALQLDYRVTESAIHRHALATGLYGRRKRNLRFLLEHVLERHSEATITLDSLLRAIRAYSSINDSGEYVERPTQVVVSSGGAYGAAAAASSQPAQSAAPAKLVRTISTAGSISLRPAKKKYTAVRTTRSASRNANSNAISNRRSKTIRNRRNS